jgi:hypothetical protein
MKIKMWNECVIDITQSHLEPGDDNLDNLSFDSILM